MNSSTHTYVGFDSAWTDKASAPGAICAVQLDEGRTPRFHAPRLASFREALEFIRSLHSQSALTLVALDQPTIVPNLTGMRPVERVAASLVSWLGGGVQPSNRGKVGMFCDASPIWRFLSDLGAVEQPEECRTATDGLYLIEVFPALALPSFEPAFFGRLNAPRYNPQRHRTFRLEHWVAVANAAEATCRSLGLSAAGDWCAEVKAFAKPSKADQDRLDSIICLLIALHWRLRQRSDSMLLGGLDHGYMVLPSSIAVRERLTSSASAVGLQAL
jgi:predicted RNase H-like nuclease